MIVETKICYSHLLRILDGGPVLVRAINRIEFDSPKLDLEGLNGYIEVNVKFHIRNLEDFTNLYSSWYVTPDSIRNTYYARAKGLG